LAQSVAKPRLAFEDTTKLVTWNGAPPQASFAWDGQHIVVTRRDADGKPGEVWLDPRTGKEVEPKALPAADRSAKPAPAKSAYQAVLVDGDVYLEQFQGVASDRGAGRRRGGRGGSANSGAVLDRTRLTEDGAGHKGRGEVHASGDGAFVSYVENNNLFVVAAKDRKTWTVTQDGGPELFHGRLDWVYQEEVYGRGNFQGHWWSPTGGMCAFLTLDESPVKDYPIVEHVPDGYLDRERSVSAEISNYPKAGDPNPFARMSVAHAASQKVVAVDLSAYPKDLLIVRVHWTDDSRLLVMIQDRIQTWCELCEVDPKTGKPTRWIREESKTWTNRPDVPTWLPDGTFLWLSERTGYQHIYRYERGGKLLGAITSGEWQVRNLERIDAPRGLLWFEGTKDGACGRHLYRIGMDGKGLVCLSPGPGTHQTELNADGSLVVDRFSATDQPPAVRVVDGVTGNVLHEVGQAAGPTSAKFAFAPKQFVSIPARDGYALDATVQRPIDWTAEQRYPVFLDTYSGPDAPTVRDVWNPSAMHQFLGGQGFLVLQINVRSASNRGQVHTGTCYRQLGVQELKDLEDAVDFVCKEHGGDAKRVAISGWSYGGFISAYALTHSTKFALGLAGAGVYDWRLYDSIYTERYMGLPDENKAGYDATSVIKAAKDLQGHLVLMHGTMDDNVHLQNTIQLLWELQKANKQNFELMLYPRSQHGLSREVGQHQRSFQWRVLRRLLDPAWKPG
jgi:dipeptidyl-peptidase-4